MGIRCWGFLVRTQEDSNEVMRLIHDHNKLASSPEGDGVIGEEMTISSFLIRKSTEDLFIEAISGGGGDMSAEWIRSRQASYKIPQIYHPWSKPAWYQAELTATDYPWGHDDAFQVQIQHQKAQTEAFAAYMAKVMAK